MTRPLALAALALAAAATFAPPAAAAPCDGMTIPQCLDPTFDRLRDRLHDVRDEVVCDPLGVC